MRGVLMGGGLVLAGAGVVLALWGPIAYEYATGYELPAPVAADRAAMSIWSGVALLRFCGALMVIAGAAIWAGQQDGNLGQAQRRALAGSLFVAAVITWIQVKAIMGSPVGYAFVVLLAGMAVATALSVQGQRQAS
ncbi:MAG: hypothetical protein GKS06_09615 [Acidobacteria bacterium]|nr:hypothetical protein [Acidobacteriota bacterium]